MTERPRAPLYLSLLIPGFRLGRLGFLIGILGPAVLLIIAMWLEDTSYGGTLEIVAGLAILAWPWIALVALINRFNDLGRPWRSLLIAWIPIIGTGFFIRLFFQRGALQRQQQALADAMEQRGEAEVGKEGKEGNDRPAARQPRMPEAQVAAPASATTARSSGEPTRARLGDNSSISGPTASQTRANQRNNQRNNPRNNASAVQRTRALDDGDAIQRM